MYLLDTWSEQAALWAVIEAGPIALAPLGDDDVPRVRELMAKYLPVDLAHVALVHVAERDRCRRVFTIDERGFAVYRVGGRERLTGLPPPRRRRGVRS